MDRTFLVLGGGGMVGTEVARLILHEISGSFPDGPARVSPRRGEYGNPPGSLGRGALSPDESPGAWASPAGGGKREAGGLLAEGGGRKAEGPSDDVSTREAGGVPGEAGGGGSSLEPGDWRIVIATLTSEEADQATQALREIAPDGVEVVGECGDVFLAEGLCQIPRRELLDDPAARRQVFDDMLGPFEPAYRGSHLAEIIRKHRPDVIVDAVNTATAISYQDVATAAVIAERDAEAVLLGETPEGLAENVQSLILSIAVPQLVRHVLILDRAMRDAGTRLYLKVGTTGTGGMGLNVPYTHSEDRPSAKLLGKTAVGFAHTGLLFLMARTPGSPIVKEVKPGALIGYRDVEHRTIREKGEAVWCYRGVREPLGESLDLRRDPKRFIPLFDLQLPVVDTGENGVFTKGEFEAITELGQMELVTPEEVAAVCLREITGANTGRDVIAAIDGAVMDPSYRGGVLRSRVLTRLEWLERETKTHSVALGQLGPPELSKLLWEAELIGMCRGTIPGALQATPAELSREVTDLLDRRAGLSDTIVSLGIPILEADGDVLRRGPRLRIPEVAGEDTVVVTAADRDRWAAKGWVDLREANFELWQRRLRAIMAARPEKGETGSSSVAAGTSETEEIRAGAVVAWVLANELGGHRG